jgi:hypothetical protein
MFGRLLSSGSGLTVVAIFEDDSFIMSTRQNFTRAGDAHAGQILSPLWGLIVSLTIPGLAPWAAFLRRSAANLMAEKLMADGCL